jgi:hypothetical protein
MRIATLTLQVRLRQKEQRLHRRCDDQSIAITKTYDLMFVVVKLLWANFSGLNVLHWVNAFGNFFMIFWSHGSQKVQRQRNPVDATVRNLLLQDGRSLVQLAKMCDARNQTGSALLMNAIC